MSTDMDIDAILADNDSQAPDPEVPPGLSWDDENIADTVKGVIDGTLLKPVPTIGIIDGCTDGLFYVGRVHDVHGEAGGGKSFVLTYVLAQEIDKHHHVIWVDLEDGPDTIIRRLLALGCSGEDITTYLHYKRPTEPSQYGYGYLHSTITEFGVTLVVIDSTGESMAMDGVGQNADEEVASWLRRVARSSADLGPAVVMLDHVPKASADALMPIGSQRKSAGLNGASYLLAGRVAFAADKTGFAHIICGKDRNGSWAKGQVVAEFHYDHIREEFSLREHATPPPATDGGFRPTMIMEKVSRFVEINPNSSGNQITTNVPHNKSAVLRAIDVLILEGHLTPTAGARGATLHTSKKPFREVDIVVGDLD